MEILPGATFEPTLTAGVVHGMHKLPHSAE